MSASSFPPPREMLEPRRLPDTLRTLPEIVVALVLIPTGIWLAAVVGEELALRRQIEALQARAAQLEEVQLDDQARRELKNSIVHDVINGRITLPEAAARFDVLFVRRDQGLRSLREAHPGASREEILCRHVIEAVRGRLEPTDPEQADAVTLRLQAELQSFLASGHGIRLPAVSFSGGEAAQQGLPPGTGNEK